jgi:hypothetical protein
MEYSLEATRMLLNDTILPFLRSISPMAYQQMGEGMLTDWVGLME